MKNDNYYLDHLRHSAAHLLAAAVLELWPEAKPTIGPSTEDGFYYDFDFGDVKVSADDLPKIEKKMKKIVQSWQEFERQEVDVKQAKERFKENEYKLELIDEFSGEDKQLTFYQSGKFTDLCRGGHVDSPNKELKHFKLLSVAGAYWRGDEKNKMLTRIYGTAFGSVKELEDYLQMQEEAKKRDHRKLGKELDLFLLHETSPGCPYWLDKGLTIMNQLLDFWRTEHRKRGYLETATPLVNKKELWVTSGHWDHYKDDMFLADMGENEIYGIKPMNCPNAMVIFGSKIRSYKDLPLRMGDSDTLHRYELSGTLNGLLRVRSFRQDDSHNFVTEDQVKQEFKEILDIAELFYGVFGLDYRLRLGTRPEKFMGDSKTWDRAEKELKEILEENDREYFVLEGDGAFYGPKIDILMKDCLGREWQMGTIQLDFQIPRNFNLKYVDKDGQEKTPVVVHRVIYGSMERFIGILIEHFAGAFPTWLSPVQVKILPITDDQQDYAQKIARKLRDLQVRVEVDDRSERLQAKIRDAQLEKVPYMLVVGKREAESGKVAVRTRNEEELGAVDVEKFASELEKEIQNRSLDLMTTMTS